MPMSFQNLRGIAVVTGFATLGGCAFFYKKIQDNLISGTYYSKSLLLLKDHEDAKTLLGVPIKTKFIDLSDSFNAIDGQKGVAQLAIPLRGSREKGILYTWSSRANPGDDWTVTKVELHLKGSSRIETIYVEGQTSEGVDHSEDEDREFR
ncbi:Cytochrome c oxidase assembly factor 1-like [Holothuria leucospilota]|uniref:Cytochrome c oxidase assembly factor 1-like n=1 Tax=Holothuria leucospilota TaxID=206669 RepID=A0A9Q0YBR1_HOLLE|nr:Cytochrome c oxidase assembly factor 1-like [Holothuria leucospilota]